MGVCVMCVCFLSLLLFGEGTPLRVDSFSILSNHRSFRKPDPFLWVSRRRIPGKNGEGSARTVAGQNPLRSGWDCCRASTGAGFGPSTEKG